MARNLKLIVALAGMAFLAGCDTPPPNVTPVASEPDIVTVKLALAAEKAAKALDVISGIDQAQNPSTPPLEDYSNVPANLMQPVSLRWSGPAEKVIKALADRAGMRFRVKGAKPAAPIIVNVDAYQQPIIHVLRNLGLQAGRRADIAVDGPGGAIELRYAQDDALPNVGAFHGADEMK